MFHLTDKNVHLCKLYISSKGSSPQKNYSSLQRYESVKELQFFCGELSYDNRQGGLSAGRKLSIVLSTFTAAHFSMGWILARSVVLQYIRLVYGCGLVTEISADVYGKRLRIRLRGMFATMRYTDPHLLYFTYFILSNSTQMPTSLLTGMSKLVHTYIHTNKFLTRLTCQFASESRALRWRQSSYE